MTERDRFLAGVRELVGYWEHQGDCDLRGKLNGLAFSILAILDGEADLPSYSVRPLDDCGIAGIEIAGTLHERFYRRED